MTDAPSGDLARGALAEQPSAWRYGYQLCRQLNLKPGSLYPILVRLADRGLLETTWDTDVPAGRPPRHLYRLTGSGRALATELAAAAAVVFAAWFLLLNRTDGTQPPLLLVLGLAAVLVVTPIAVFFVPAFVAGWAGRSLRSGLQAAVWTLAAVVPLTYAVWLSEALRRHAIDGRLLLDGEVVAPVGANLADALVFCLGIFPVLGLTLGVIGAALGARRAIPDDPS